VISNMQEKFFPYA